MSARLGEPIAAVFLCRAALDPKRSPLAGVVSVSVACSDQTAPERVKTVAAPRVPLFSGEVTGLGVQLPDWRYPVVAQLDTGELRYDNYSGRWGEQQHLDRFLQTYAVETVKSQARRKGHSVTEQPLSDGSIRLSIGLS